MVLHHRPESAATVTESCDALACPRAQHHDHVGQTTMSKVRNDNHASACHPRAFRLSHPDI
jgi:hypothetical protein